ncbi:MAG: IS21 family transposase [Candidatus Aeolococcus gillhamiae]|uniref:IS21 family transposase n=1 Tax=Candidatus Aeolococcus gillhamiae TaxID=3127015 RepID=A0A2W5Z3Q0_9BACT|nr:MAG: IS21 family transposase [Candidatus Dormibacter sp. RRmetagenome_bin12]
MIDVVEVLQHWHAGRPKSVVASSLGIDPKTVRKYVAKATEAGLCPGGPALGRAEWAELVRGWFPELVDAKARSLTFGVIDTHRERIADMLATNTVATAHQRLRDEHGLTVGVSSFRRFVASEFPDSSLRDRVTVLRPDVAAGEEAQIDYGHLGSWQDPDSGRVRRVWAFVMVLACSRHMFVRPVLRLDARSWVAAHVAAFAFFGGAPRRLVPDNLATGVDRPDLYDPKINRAYAELAAHYGALVDPARALKPKDKPRVERPMPYVRDSMWRGREWRDEAHMQAAALTWCVEVAGRRHHRSLEGAQPLAVFNAIEAEELIALPPAVFELAGWSTPKVGPDCHVKVAKTLYSVPWRYIGRPVDAREGERTVEMFVDGAVIKTWARLDKGRQTDWDDYPPEKVAFFIRTPTWCRRRAAELGTSVTEVVASLLEINALHRLRSAQGVVGLADRYSAERLDAACARAVTVGDPSYRTVKGILVAGTESESPAETDDGATAPAHLHGPTGLFDTATAS